MVSGGDTGGEWPANPVFACGRLNGKALLVVVTGRVTPTTEWAVGNRELTR